MEIHGYTQTGSIEATIDGVRMTVPHDMANRHRQMIAEWEEQGNTIPPYVAPAPANPLAQPLDRLRFWLAAASVGVSKWSVRDRIAAMPETTYDEKVAKDEAIAWFEEAKQYRRDDPLLIQLAAAEGISGESLDGLWTWAVQSQP
jgi:hypothetical protein